MRRDPAQPLPAAPDPWVSSEMPTPRDGPPWHMTEMIEAEPALAERLLRRLAAPDGQAARLATAIRSTAAARRPILVTGCGTSEHAALAVGEILREAMAAAGLPSRLGQSGAPVAVQAFEGSLEASLGGSSSLVIGISHEGGTWATNRALEAAKRAGSTVALVTVSDRSPGAAIADLVVATDEQDQSWCHTVGYLSPILVAAALAGHLTGQQPDAGGVARLLAAGLEQAAVDEAERLATSLATVDRLLVTASGADRVTARELVLKIEEGTHLPAAMRDLETVLHGHLAGMDGATGFILILADDREGEARAGRAAGVLRAVAELGIRAGAILGAAHEDAIPEALTPAGRIVAPSIAGIPSAAHALLASVVPLQLVTERLARARGVNPDPNRRDDPAYLRAADAAG